MKFLGLNFHVTSPQGDVIPTVGGGRQVVFSDVEVIMSLSFMNFWMGWIVRLIELDVFIFGGEWGGLVSF